MATFTKQEVCIPTGRRSEPGIFTAKSSTADMFLSSFWLAVKTKRLSMLM